MPQKRTEATNKIKNNHHKAYGKFNLNPETCLFSNMYIMHYDRTSTDMNKRVGKYDQNSHHVINYVICIYMTSFLMCENKLTLYAYLGMESSFPNYQLLVFLIIF